MTGPPPRTGTRRRGSPRGALALGAVVLAVAEAASRLGWLPPLVLPAPSAVATALVTHAGELAGHSAQTLAETLTGFTLAVFAGAAVALAPVLLVWLGFGLPSKVLVVALSCFFLVAVATLDGLGRTDPTLLDLARSLNATPTQTEWWWQVPSALPSVFSGLKVAATYAVTSAIFAEYVGAYAGLGIFIQTSAGARATDLVFAAITLSALYSVLLVQAVLCAQGLALRGRPTEGTP